MDDADIVYEYRPALMGSPWLFRLQRDGLHWSMGRHEGVVPYDAIARVRLSFRPLTMQTYRFLTEIWPRQGPKLTIASTTWRSIAAQERQDAAYTAFILELHRRIARAGGGGTFVNGTPPLLYWTGLIVFAAIFVAFAALIVRALQEQAWAGGAIVAAFFALFLWQVGGLLLRNRPGRYRPEAPPPHLLPRG